MKQFKRPYKLYNILKRKSREEAHDLVVFGAGALGNVIARYQFLTGKSIGLYSRRSWADAVGEKGVEFVRGGSSGEILERDRLRQSERFTFYSDDTQDQLRNRGLKPNGLVVLASKTPNLEEILQAAEAVIDPKRNQYILMIQNGICPEVGVEEILKRKYDDPRRKNNGVSDRLVGGVVMARMAISDYKNPTINYGIAEITLGSWNNFESKKDSMIEINDSLSRSLIGVATVGIATDQMSYRKVRMEKAAKNGANSVSALFNAKVGEILDNPVLNQTMRHKLEEAVAVARALDIPIDSDELMKSTRLDYDKKVRSHFASMAQDLQLAARTPGRMLVTEIDHLDLAFYRMGSPHGVSTPMYLFYGGLMEDFTCAYNTLKAVDSRNGSNKAKEFANEFLRTNRSLAGLEGTSSRISPESLADKVYESLQELKSIHLKDCKKDVGYRYTLEPRVEKPTLHILVVDDEKDNANITAERVKERLSKKTEITERYKVEVLTAYSALQAVEVSAGKNNIGIVVADVVMPEQRGYEMAERFPITTQFIYYSGQASLDDKMKIRRRPGSPEILMKPFEYGIEDLIDAITFRIEKYEQQTTMF
ncbi:hypothetical protein HYX18_02540 [Candidatus Woesearchaeota archaeon]|nr:hypothetical protein [Candidatus Woesearchaeota archaeon]